MMADRLPLEIIEQILGYLRPSDRLSAATICLSWYEASLSRLLWNDIILVLDNSLEDVAQIFKQTRKPIQHVRIKDVSFTSSNSEVFSVWNHICPGILTLEIKQSFMTEANVLNLLLPCHSLESIHFHDCRDTFITGQLFNNSLVLNHIRLAAPNLKELCLADNGSYLSDALLDRFMTIVSNNVKYLSFAGTSVSFHPGIHKKFYPDSITEEGSIKSSELVLTFDSILGHILNHSATIKFLDFSRTLINDKACTLLSQVKNLQLSTLLLRGCEISNAGLVALCDTQSTLIELDVSSCARVTDCALSSICSGLPNLKVLSLQSCRAITDVGISCLTQLSKLESINLQGLERITSHGVEQGLLLKTNFKLRRLNLSATRVTEETLYQLAQNAPMLSHLDLTSCVKAVSDSSLQVLWKSLRQLRELRLDWCVGLSDAGFLADHVGESSSTSKAACIADLKGLTLLSISGCSKITDRSLQYAFGFQEMRHLNLNACSLITDGGLAALAEFNQGLEVLVLNYCNKISDNGVIEMISSLSRLNRLELHGCVKLTNKTLAAIEGYRLRYLKYLNVSHCKSMSLERADLLQMRLPSIRELSSSGLD